VQLGLLAWHARIDKGMDVTNGPNTESILRRYRSVLISIDVGWISGHGTLRTDVAHAKQT
jgi:hypothetical protein